MTTKTSFEVDAVVEIPRESCYKYEVDKKTGGLTVDRPLPKPLPYNYGYIPNTLHDDGDALDICVIGNIIFPLARVKVIVLGAFKCTDNGVSDHKLYATVAGEIISQNDLVGARMNIRHYLETYKEGFVVDSEVGAEEAYGILMKDVQAYLHE